MIMVDKIKLFYLFFNCKYLYEYLFQVKDGIISFFDAKVDTIFTTKLKGIKNKKMFVIGVYNCFDGNGKYVVYKER